MDEELIDIIYLFNSVGIRIVFINDRYYTFSSFDPATNNTRRHRVIGKDITKLLSQSSSFRNTHVDPNAVSQLMMKLAEQKDRTIEFSEHYKYIMYA